MAWTGFATDLTLYGVVGPEYTAAAPTQTQQPPASYPARPAESKARYSGIAGGFVTCAVVVLWYLFGPHWGMNPTDLPGPHPSAPVSAVSDNLPPITQPGDTSVAASVTEPASAEAASDASLQLAEHNRIATRPHPSREVPRKHKHEPTQPVAPLDDDGGAGEVGKDMSLEHYRDISGKI